MLDDIRHIGDVSSGTAFMTHDDYVVTVTSGGLAHRETGRFPGGPLLHEVFRAPGRTREFNSFINQLTQSAYRVSIQRTGHNVRRVSPSEQMTVIHIHSCAGYTAYQNQKLFLMKTKSHLAVFTTITAGPD